MALLTATPASAAACRSVAFNPNIPNVNMAPVGSNYTGSATVLINCTSGGANTDLGGQTVEIDVNVINADASAPITIQTNLVGLANQTSNDNGGSGVTFSGTIPGNGISSFPLHFTLSVPIAEVIVQGGTIGTDGIVELRLNSGGNLVENGESGAGSLFVPSAGATPELDSIVLFGLGVVGLGGVAWRQRRKAQTIA
jgi:hypothetical protein